MICQIAVCQIIRLNIQLGGIGFINRDRQFNRMNALIVFNAGHCSGFRNLIGKGRGNRIVVLVLIQVCQFK